MITNQSGIVPMWQTHSVQFTGVSRHAHKVAEYKQRHWQYWFSTTSPRHHISAFIPTMHPLTSAPPPPSHPPTLFLPPFPTTEGADVVLINKLLRLAMIVFAHVFYSVLTLPSRLNSRRSHKAHRKIHSSSSPSPPLTSTSRIDPLTIKHMTLLLMKCIPCLQRNL